MTRYVFERVEHRAAKRLPCPVCGKRLSRARTFSQTLNPWNVNPDGTERTRSDIIEALGPKVREWQALPEPCASHEGVRQYGSVDVGGGA